MTATVTPIIDFKPEPKAPFLKPYKTWQVAFGAADTESDWLDKPGLQLVGFNFPAFTTASALTFKVSRDKVNSRVLRGASIDLTTEEAEGTSLLAEWPFFKMVLDVAEGSAKNIEVSAL